MIYSSSYLSKELRQAYSSRRAASWRKTALGLFLGLFSFALYFMAQTMTESIFAESAPQVMQADYFSTLYIYVHVAAVLYTIYLIVYYDTLFYGEIRRKAWYPLIQLGYRPGSMILAKIVALFASTLYVYSLGFGFTVFLTFFLKYALVTSYMPALYLAGLIDLFLVSAAALFLSALFKTTTNARYATFVFLILVFVLKTKTGFYRILSNSLAMKQVQNLWDFQRSPYLALAAIIFLAFVLLGAIMARFMARSYKPPANHYHAVLAGRDDVVRLTRSGRSKKIGDQAGALTRRKLLDVAISFLLVVFILAAILFNIAILVINATAKGKIASFQGVIPYVFKSQTMEPEIKVNDLAFFNKFEGEPSVNLGQIVLFEEDEVIFVERVIAIAKDGSYLVDIDQYPDGSENESLVKTVSEDQMIGLYRGRSRWLGAIILFANTIFGRILLLLIPAVLLFFQRSVTGWAGGRKKILQ